MTIEQIMKEGVAYYRVSTDKQGESGLGLEAQRDSVHLFVKGRRLRLSREFTEIESGKKSKNRPVLQEALSYCGRNNAILIIAKLDRLGRNVAFISALMESKVEFVAVDLPEANRLILHIMAAFAEFEREQISSRTKAALQIAKNRGVELGKYGKVLAQYNHDAAISFSQKLRPVIEDLKTEGFATVEALTNELNKRNIPAYRKGAKWHKSTVHTLLKRIARVQEA